MNKLEAASQLQRIGLWAASGLAAVDSTGMVL